MRDSILWAMFERVPRLVLTVVTARILAQDLGAAVQKVFTGVAVKLGAS